MYWGDPVKKNPLENQNSKRETGNPPQSSSFYANQFLNECTRPERRAQNADVKHVRFSDRYIQSASQKRAVPNTDEWTQSSYPQQENFSNSDGSPPRKFVNRDRNPIYENNEFHKTERAFSQRWNFLDLKNRKQTGDLYKRILYYNKKNGSKTFCLTSSRPREGVSTILANLVDYIRHQATDKTILVIDANLQHPNLHQIFSIPRNSYNIDDIFKNRVGVQDAFIPISSNIFVLPCGDSSRNRSENLEPENFLKLLDECKQMFDYILIDCPPVLSSSDSLSVAPAADISFLIIESIKVQRPVAQKAVSILQDNECKIGGVVLNRVIQVIPNWVYKFI